jgi:hypothetical protein
MSRQESIPDRPAASRQRGRWIWVGALMLFIVAGGTGVLYRFGVAHGWTGGLRLENIRHAHSHLMYFGWGTPLLMSLLWHSLPEGATAPYRRPFRWAVGCTFGAALLAYSPFLLFGYSLVPIGTAELPVAAMAAGLNIFCWYGFAGLYVRATANLSRTAPLRIWDLAVGFLVLSTLGAWGLPLAAPLGLDTPLGTTALIHFFLDLFSEGWFVLGAVGVAWSRLRKDEESRSLWPVYLAGVGVPFTFLYVLPPERLPIWAKLLGRAGGTAVGVGTAWVVLELWRSGRPVSWIWAVPIALLLFKALAGLGGSLFPGLWLGARHGLRILYLHLTLLGFFSTALVAGSWHTWGKLRSFAIASFYGAIGLVLASLVPLTSLTPSTSGSYALAAWMAMLPVLAAVWLLADSLKSTVHFPADRSLRAWRNRK